MKIFQVARDLKPKNSWDSEMDARNEKGECAEKIGEL